MVRNRDLSITSEFWVNDENTEDYGHGSSLGSHCEWDSTPDKAPSVEGLLDRMRGSMQTTPRGSWLEVPRKSRHSAPRVPSRELSAGSRRSNRSNSIDTNQLMTSQSSQHPEEVESLRHTSLGKRIIAIFSEVSKTIVAQCEREVLLACDQIERENERLLEELQSLRGSDFPATASDLKPGTDMDSCRYTSRGQRSSASSHRKINPTEASSMVEDKSSVAKTTSDAPSSHTKIRNQPKSAWTPPQGHPRDEKDRKDKPIMGSNAKSPETSEGSEYAGCTELEELDGEILDAPTKNGKFQDVHTVEELPKSAQARITAIKRARTGDIGADEKVLPENLMEPCQSSNYFSPVIPASGESGKTEPSAASALSRRSVFGPKGDSSDVKRRVTLVTDKVASERPSVKGLRFAGDDGIEDSNNFLLRSNWNTEEERLSVTSTFTTKHKRSRWKPLKDQEEEDSDSDEENLSSSSRFWNVAGSFVIKPTSIRLLLWDSLSSIMILYDCIFIPIEFMDLPSFDSYGSIRGLSYFDMVIRVYWTLDMPVNLFTAFVTRNGRLEMKPKVVVWNYFSGWFLWDLMQISTDWLVFFSGYLSLRLNAVLMRSFRLLRMVRLVRLIRAKKLDAMKNHLFNDTEHVSALMSLIRIVLLVVWFNHLVACVWYSIGKGSELGGDDSWVKIVRDSVDNIDVGHAEELYLVSYCWSLSQFVGENYVRPSTMLEHVFVAISGIISYVTSAWMVSSITSSMTRLEIANAYESKRFALLRQFLAENHISKKIADRVTRNAEFHVTQQKKKTRESDIELLSLISEPLRIEVRYEIHMNVFGQHPFFMIYATLSQTIMRKVCFNSTLRIHMARGDVLFRKDEFSSSPQMYFLVDGKMAYLHRGVVKNISTREWLCEQSMWTDWTHCGTARARTECTLVSLSMESFAHLTRDDADVTRVFINNYGLGFVKHLNETPTAWLSDCEDVEMDIAWLVQKSLPEGMEPNAEKLALQALQVRFSPSSTTGGQIGWTLTYLPGKLFKNSSRSSSISDHKNSTHKNSVTSIDGRVLKRGDSEKLKIASNLADAGKPQRRTRVAHERIEEEPAGTIDKALSLGTSVCSKSEIGSFIGSDTDSDENPLSDDDHRFEGILA